MGFCSVSLGFYKGKMKLHFCSSLYHEPAASWRSAELLHHTFFSWDFPIEVRKEHSETETSSGVVLSVPRLARHSDLIKDFEKDCDLHKGVRRGRRTLPPPPSSPWPALPSSLELRDPPDCDEVHPRGERHCWRPSCLATLGI